MSITTLTDDTFKYCFILFVSLLFFFVCFFVVVVVLYSKKKVLAFHVNRLLGLFSMKNKKEIECRLLQILLGALRVYVMVKKNTCYTSIFV